MAFSRELEIKTLRKMIAMHCHAQHLSQKDELCKECGQLLKYAEQRIDKCLYGDDKPVCSKCPVHCYKPEMKTRIKEVMQYSGPRMLWQSPILSMRYMYRKKFKSDVDNCQKT